MKYILIVTSLLLFGAGCASGSPTKPLNAPVPNAGSQKTSQAPAPREVEIQINSSAGGLTIEEIK